MVPLKAPIPNPLTAFFEKFDQLADAPETVAEVRSLILYFAVTGKLSAQLPDDAPVSQLIAELSKAKAHRGKTRGRASTAVASNNSDTNRPISAPSHWAWVPLNEIGSLSGGMTPSKAKSVFWDGDVNWFSSKDIKKDELTESELKITRVGADSTGLQIYPPGCLVMVARSGILKRTFPVSILRAEGTVNQDLKVLSPYVGGLERYIQIMLRGMTDFILTSLVKTGMTVQSLVYEEFEVQPFPFPPLAEQKRIVAKVDELMAQCDRLEAQLKARDEKHAVLARAALSRFAESPTTANLELLFHDSFAIPPADLRKTILTLAVQGQLVPQDPKDEPADVLLTKIAKEIGIKEGPRKTSDSDPDLPRPFDLPAGWSWSRFSELGEFGRGKSKNRPRNDSKLFIGGTYPLVQTGDVARSNGRVTTFTSCYNDVGLAQSKMWPAGTMCITIAANIADSGILDFDACFPDSVVGFIPAKAIPSVRYFEYFVRTAKENLEKFAPSTAQKNINLGILEQVSIPIPPAAEQRRIVKRVDELMTLVDQLETQLTATRATAVSLLSALIAELTGTPNNRNVSSSPASGTGRRGRPRKSP